MWKYPHWCLKLTLCSTICVKLLPQRELGLSISTYHLRMVLISQTRRRSFGRRVRLLQNDLSTPSSPVALLSTPHTSLSTVAMATVWQGWALSKALRSLAKTPLHTLTSVMLLLIQSFWSSFDGDIKPGGIQDVPDKNLTPLFDWMRRRFSPDWSCGPAGLLSSSSQIAPHYLQSTDRRPSRSQEQSFLLLHKKNSADL